MTANGWTWEAYRQLDQSPDYFGPCEVCDERVVGEPMYVLIGKHGAAGGYRNTHTFGHAECLTKHIKEKDARE